MNGNTIYGNQHFNEMIKESRGIFANKLLSTTIPSNMCPDEQQTKLESLQKAANEIMPKSLYRYRSCSECSFSAFDRDELWISTADCMNDGYDTRIYINQDEVNQKVRERFRNGLNKETLFEKVENAAALPPELTQAAEKMQQMSDDDLIKLMEQIISWITMDTAKALQQIPSIGQQTLKFCCFSEKIFSPAMWGIYSSDETGFALEYDFSQTPYAVSPNQFSRECTLFPVIYFDRRYQVPTEYILYLLEYRLYHSAFSNSGLLRTNPAYVNWFLSTGICPDLLMGTKISLHKSDEWEREAEWRLFCTSINDSAFQQEKHGYCLKRPVGLYLGRRISPINEKILRKIAEEKDIPIYKMVLDDQPEFVG